MMERNVTVNINMGSRCAECGKPGATDSGIRLRCANKALAGKPMCSRQGQIVADRFRGIVEKARRTLA